MSGLAWLFVGIGFLASCFGGVLLVGAPYLPTLTPQLHIALDLSGLRAGDMLLELGCGDGKVLLAAAERGIKVVGYELNPIMALVAWWRTRRYRRLVKVVWGNFWQQDWPRADAIFAFLLPRYMERLNKKVMQYRYRPVKLLSFAFSIPHKPADTKEQGVYLYIYR